MAYECPKLWPRSASNPQVMAVSMRGVGGWMWLVGVWVWVLVPALGVKGEGTQGAQSLECTTESRPKVNKSLMFISLN